MQPTICGRCQKNMAVIFITKIENGQSKNEGLCLKCARELHIKPVDDIIKKMGISDEELEGLTNEMMDAFGGAEGLMEIEGENQEGHDGHENNDSDPNDDIGKTATFPFINRLFGGQDSPTSSHSEGTGRTRDSKDQQTGRPGKRKFLENYCISLTQRAIEGKLDRIIAHTRTVFTTGRIRRCMTFLAVKSI